MVIYCETVYSGSSYLFGHTINALRKSNIGFHVVFLNQYLFSQHYLNTSTLEGVWAGFQFSMFCPHSTWNTEN